MTMAELRQKRKEYESLQAEIADFTEQIKDLERRLIVTDVVKGSSAEYPYTERPVKIVGKGTNTESKVLTQRAKEIKEEKVATQKALNEAVSFINGIDDRLIKKAVKLRVTQGMSWQQIVNRFGNVVSEAALIMRVKRTLKKI